MAYDFYALTTYEYDTYSYTGTGEADVFYFRTLEAAKKYAADNGIEVVEFPMDYMHDIYRVCSIDGQNFQP